MPESELYNNGAFVSFANFVGHKCLSILISLFFLAMLIEQSEGWNRISVQPKFRRQFFMYQLPYSAINKT